MGCDQSQWLEPCTVENFAPNEKFQLVGIGSGEADINSIQVSINKGRVYIEQKITFEIKTLLNLSFQFETFPRQVITIKVLLKIL